LLFEYLGVHTLLACSTGKVSDSGWTFILER